MPTVRRTGDANASRDAILSRGWSERPVGRSLLARGSRPPAAILTHESVSVNRGATGALRRRGAADGQPCDAIVIGGGHNGLVAGAYLAREGRTVVLEARTGHRRRGATETPWGPDFKITALSYVMSLMPPPSSRAWISRGTATRCTRWVRRYIRFPDGRSLLLHYDEPDRHAESRQVLQGRRRSRSAIGSVDGRRRRRARPAAHDARRSSARGGRTTCSSSCASRGGCAGSTCAASDVTRLFTMSIRDLLDRWFESRGGRRDGDQRHHRHLGRPRRARHRLRDAAPLDRRRRRRPARQLGLPARRHGRGGRRHPPLRRVVRRDVRTDAPGRADPRAAAARSTGVALRRRRGAACRTSSWRRRTRRSRSSARSTTGELPDDFVADLKAGGAAAAR